MPVSYGMTSSAVRPPTCTMPSTVSISYRDEANREFQPNNTSLEARSRSPSPNPTPTPGPVYEYYGTANLTDRSRSPSPSSTAHTESTSRNVAIARQPVIMPKKPSALNLSPFYVGGNMPHVLPSPTVPQPHKSPGSINFPKLSASPSHGPHEWNDIPYGASNVPRSASSEQLYQAFRSNMLKSNHPDRAQYSNQPMQPAGHQNYEILKQMALKNWAQSHKRPELPIHSSNYGYGGTVDGTSSNTLPRSYRYDQPLPAGQRSHGPNVAPVNQTSVKHRKHSDSEDEDWC